LIKGTSTRTAEQLADQIEELGGSIGSEAGNNSLGVAIRVMRPDVEVGLQILADTLLHATIPEKAVAREKEVQLARIKEEEEEMTSLARNLLREHLFRGHPYGLRHYGTPESVARLNRADLIRFRDQHIVGRNGVISVFGDVRALEVKALVERAFAELPPGAPQFDELPAAPSLPASDELKLVKEKEQAILMVGFPGSDLFSADNAALELIDEACSDLGSRLFVRIREEMGLAYFVGSSHWAGLVRGAFTFYLGTSPEKLDDVKAALLEEIAKLARDGLTAQEIARAKQKLVGQQEIRNQNNHSFAHSAALDELYGLGHSHYRQLRREIEALTLEDVQRVARTYFDQPRIVAIVRPS
jgi:zinc protease